MKQPSPIRLHIANIDLCDIVTDSAVDIIETLLENLDPVSKYKVACELISRLDNHSQIYYDEASSDEQLIIEALEDCHWNYSSMPSYTEYEDFIDKFLYVSESGVQTTQPVHTPIEYPDDDMHDVAEEFDIPRHNTQLQGQLHFPNDYASEIALSKGVVSTTTVDTQAEQKKQARAQFLANVKAQQNTSQSN